MSAVVESPHPSGLVVLSWHEDVDDLARRVAELHRAQRPMDVYPVTEDDDAQG